MDRLLFFLIKECEFTVESIYQNPQLLTMDYYILKERAIFLKSRNSLIGKG